MSDFAPNPRNFDGEMMCTEQCKYYYRYRRQGSSLSVTPNDCSICSDETHCLPWYVQEYEKLRERIAELEGE